MKTILSYTDPIIFSLPEQGKEEYINWIEYYSKISQNLLNIVDALRKLIVLEPDKADYYDSVIDDRLHKAYLTMMEWQLMRRHILNKYLRDC